MIGFPKDSQDVRGAQFAKARSVLMALFSAAALMPLLVKAVGQLAAYFTNQDASRYSQVALGEDSLQLGVGRFDTYKTVMPDSIVVTVLGAFSVIGALAMKLDKEEMEMQSEEAKKVA
mmetsp:Transcript_26856/g.46649  ORF Transcript_26856/g.46649 Transcript_26856/m.46649 type:complete len:118 (+) Transcript_26856:93-446(+)